MPKSLAQNLTTILTHVKGCEKGARRLRRTQCFFMFFNLIAATFSVLWLTLYSALVQVLFAWWMYRNYRKYADYEKRWALCRYHTQRMWVERNNEPQAFWHSCQLDLEIEKLKRDMYVK